MNENPSRVEEVLLAILGRGTVTSVLISRIEKILDAIRVEGSYDDPTLSEIEEILLCILRGERYEEPTHSRIADMLKVKANGGEYTELRLSRVEDLIYDWINDVEYATYEGTLPAILDTKSGYLKSYKIYGNTVQDGTPTPENPIMPSGCGELETAGVHAGQYKLPLTVNGVEYPIYLGEAETRRIKKLVFDGTENWTYQSENTRFMLYLPNAMFLGVRLTPTICTHYITIDDGRSIAQVPNNAIYIGGSSDVVRVYIKTDDYTTARDFKSFLTAQYANGTPVTIWYVLEEPEIAVINEPLRKIGDYADTIDSTQTTVQIPTFDGSTTIVYEGTPAPEKVELVYKI